MSTKPVDELIGQIDDELYMQGLRLEVIRPEVEQRNTPWMHRLIMDFHDIAVDSFGRSLPYEAIDGRTREADVLTVLRGGDGEALAYTVNARLLLAGIPVNYFATALARRRMQGKGFYRLINPLREALLPDAQAVYYFPVTTVARILRFEVLKSSGGNTGAAEIEVYASE